MNRPIKIILAVTAVAVAMWLGWAKALKPMYLEPRAQALASIETNTATLASYQRNQADHARVLRDLRAVGDRTLGTNLEMVDDRLRNRLNRIAEQSKLRNIATGTTGQASPKATPAKVKFSSDRTLANEVDFYELEGWVSGTGTFEQTLALVRAIDTEPWIKRIHHLSLDPRDNGERFSIMLRLTTLFIPGYAPRGDATATASPPDMQQYAALAASNPFRVPPPPAAAPVAKSPSAPAPFPYEQWSLTGIAQSAAGQEIWLLNRQTHETRRLLAGETIEDLVFLAAHGEIAEFSAGELRFSITIGSFLSDRNPVN